MANEVKLFMEAVESATGRIPVWYPGTEVSLGDIGVFDKGQWTHKTTLKAQEIPFSAYYDKNPSDGLDLSRGDEWALGVDGGAEGGVPGGPSGHAVLKLSLSGSGSFVFRTADSLVHRIEDLDNVEGEMLSRFQADDGTWDEKWCVVSEVFVGSRSFMAVADGTSATLDLNLGVKPSGAVLNLAEAKAGAHISRTKNVSSKFLSMAPTVLTFNVRRATWNGAAGGRGLAGAAVEAATTADDMNWEGTGQSSPAGS